MANAVEVASGPSLKARAYDKVCVPVFIQPFMDEVAALASDYRGDVLETACGTGVATAAIVEGGRAIRQLVATDLDADMLLQARSKRWPSHVSFSTADARHLPYQARSFDAGICIFGLMFVPDVERALSSMRRVLRPGSPLHLMTWGCLADNEAFRIGDEVRARLYPQDRQHFGRDVLCRFSQAGPIEAALVETGFSQVDSRPVRRRRSVAPMDLARNLVGSRGHPVEKDLRDAGDLYRRMLGDRPALTMAANLISARA